MRKQQKSGEKTQVERFKEKARELGCDEDEAAFERKLKRIIPKKPQQKEPNGKT